VYSTDLAVEPDDLTGASTSISSVPKLIQLYRRARGDGVVKSAIARVEQRLADMNKTLMRIERQLARLEGGGIAPPVTKIDVDRWVEVAQEGELDWHKKPNVRATPDWDTGNAKMWAGWGFDPSEWANKLVLDVGAGSRLRTLYFKGARIAAIEPLGERYADEVQWQDIDKADEVYCVPAETLVPELVGRADLIVSINALDHGYDFEQSIVNIRRYAKPDATVFLSFDLHDVPDHMHPLVISDELARQIFERSGFEVVRSSRRSRYHGAAGPDAVNYWLHPSVS
jgi:hypothetical protein